MNPDTPVIVGASQLQQRFADPTQAAEPVAMMLDAVRRAAEDSGTSKVLDACTSVRVTRGLWRYSNPARWLAEQLGLGSVEMVGTAYGGNLVQSMVNRSALDIQAGRHRCIVLTGAENGYSQSKARRAGVKLGATETPGEYDLMLGSDRDMTHEAERARGIVRPIQYYPMFENALRHARGESIAAHGRRIAELWARFSAVASRNPDAWIHEAQDAASIAEPSSVNRPVSFPYPKLMNSNNAVDMGAALILCSVSLARELGIPEERWVYPWAGTDAHDHFHVSERDSLCESPAIRIAGRRVLELAGLGTDDLDLIDIYSCFPVAVQVACAELGLDEQCELTVTGGLTFGGGPLNNYVMHSIARMVGLCREQPQARGLITANGGYLTKHSFGIYSAMQPAADFRHADVQPEVDVLPRRQVLVEHDGEAVIEAYTVMFGADGGSVGHAACLTDDGHRTWANTHDADLMSAMQQEEFCGRRVRIDGAGGFRVL